MEAQRITHEYHNVSIADALRELSQQSSGYTLYFLYDELEDFRITTTVSRKSLPDAIQQMIGFYPIRMTVDTSDPAERKIFVECTHKTDRHLTGTIVDEHGQPVAYANVAVLNPADSALLSGGVSNESGYFAIPYSPLQSPLPTSPRGGRGHDVPGLSTPPPSGGGWEGAILARISYVGYKTLYKLCPQPNVGTIRLQPDNYTLKGVTVKGYKPAMKMTPGGMEIDVEGTLLAQMGTATDVLDQLPRVTVSPTGAVSVFGKGTPIIYINSRLVRDLGELTRLKSANIKSVEVITAPGAQYDATAESVIRIRTVKRQGEGFSVNTESNLSNNGGWRGYEDLTMKYSTDKLEVMVNGFYRHVYQEQDNQFGQILYALDDPTEVRASMFMKQKWGVLYGATGVNYDFNDSTSIGLNYSVYRYFNDTGDATGPQEIWRNGQLADRLTETQHINATTGPNHDLDAYFTGKVGRLTIDFNGTCIWRREQRSDLTLERGSATENRDVHTDMTQHNRMQAAKLVLTYPVLKGELSLGTETTHTQTQGSYANAEGYADDSETNIRESNTAYFTEFHRPLGHFDLRAGLRYEHVNSRYYSFGELQDGLSRRYDQWFPNVGVAWSKGKWGLQMNYNKRTLRPSYWQLRNFLQYDNRYAFEGGNPQLRPEMKHSLGVDAKYAWLSLQVAYAYQKDAILWASVLDPEQAVSVLSNRNFDHYQSLSASISASPKFGFWQPTWDVGIQQTFFDIGRWRGFEIPDSEDADFKSASTAFSRYKPCLTLNLRNRFAVSKATLATLNAYWQTWGYDGFIASRPSFNLAASLQQSFLREALTVRLYASDLLKTSRERWTMYGLGVNLYKDCYNSTRQVGLTITYDFNPSRSKYKGTGAGNDEKSRL